MSIRSLANKLNPWYNTVARPNTAMGDYMLDQFIANLHAIVGGNDTIRLLELFRAANTTDLTSDEKDGKTVTADNNSTILSRLTRLGAGYGMALNGTNGELDTPDSADLSFGDGITDLPFTVVILTKLGSTGTLMSLVAKEDSATEDEWRLFIDGSTRPVFQLTDASESSYIGRRDATALGTSDWVLLGGSYVGGQLAAGINVWVNAKALDDTDNSSGTYTAMEDKNAAVHTGARYSSKEQFFNGSIAMVMVCSIELTEDQWWAIKNLVNSFFDLSL